MRPTHPAPPAVDTTPEPEGRVADETSRLGLGNRIAVLFAVGGLLVSILLALSTLVLTRRQLGLLLGAVVLLAVVVLCSLAFGARSVPVAEAWRSLVDPDPTSSDHLVVRDLHGVRLIRVCRGKR